MVTLKPHQQAVIDWKDPSFQHLDPEKFGLFFAPRVGKTYTILELFKKYNINDGLIVVPKKLKPQWLEEVKNWDANHTVITKEEFKRDHKMLPRYNAIAIDECHHFSNTKSQLTKSMLWYMKAHGVQYRWLATGTPYRSSPLNIYALYVLLGKPINYWGFFQKFYIQISMGNRLVPKPRPHMEAELETYVKNIGMTLALKDVADVPESVDIVEIFDMTEEQTKAIQMIEEPVFISRFSKMHQIEQGFIYGDEYTATESFPSLKNDRILDLVKQHDKIAISCKFTHQIDLLASLLAFRDVYIIDGRTEDRYAVEKQIKQSASCVVILQAGASEGMDLSSIDTMVFASLSFSHLDHVQTKARLENLEVLHENTYYYLLTSNIDVKVHKRIMEHKDFHESLFINEY